MFSNRRLFYLANFYGVIMEGGIIFERMMFMNANVRVITPEEYDEEQVKETISRIKRRLFAIKAITELAETDIDAKCWTTKQKIEYLTEEIGVLMETAELLAKDVKSLK